jgi:hypothetical protein
MLRPVDGKGESGLQHDNLFSWFAGAPMQSGDDELLWKKEYFALC